MLNKQAYKSTQKSQILRYKKSQHKKPVFRQISKIKIKIAETKYCIILFQESN